MSRFSGFALALCALVLLCHTGCSLLDRATGTDVVAGTADPNGGTAGAALRVADGLLPSPFNLIAEGLLSVVTLYQAIRLRNRGRIIDAAQAAIAATADGIRAFTEKNPTAAQQLTAHVEAAHAEAEVDAVHTLALGLPTPTAGTPA